MIEENQNKITFLNILLTIQIIGSSPSYPNNFGIARLGTVAKDPIFIPITNIFPYHNQLL